MFAKVLKRTSPESNTVQLRTTTRRLPSAIVEWDDREECWKLAAQGILKDYNKTYGNGKTTV